MGAILDRYNDLRNPELSVDKVRPELPEFTVTVAADGSFVDSGNQTTIKGYVLSVYGIQAWAAGGTVPGDAAPSLISFNIHEGRGQDMFRNSVRLQGFMETQESSWFMPYRCIPGTDLTCAWSIATTWVAQINAQRVFGVRLLGDYYLCP